MDKDIMVSIVCNTYNHEAYIEKALKGFVEQKTQYKFEVLLHDDASTDNTVKIIQKYEKLYPDLIKPIYQKYNQYSVDPNRIVEIQWPRITGKYVAFCEGDDYWIDDLKLEKQIRCLESNPYVDFCVHATEIRQNNKTVGIIAPKNESCIISCEDMLKGKGGYIATNSWLMRSNLLENLPEFMRETPYDYAYQVYASLRGGAAYINDVMSVYNYMNNGSWSQKRKINNEFAIKENRKIIHLYEEFNQYTGRRYENIIDQLILYYYFENDWYSGKIAQIIKNHNYRSILSLKDWMKVYLRFLFPKIYEFAWRKKNNL